jgi:aminobenzoyl-glutamate utilization protein B
MVSRIMPVYEKCKPQSIYQIEIFFARMFYIRKNRNCEMKKLLALTLSTLFICGISAQEVTLDSEKQAVINMLDNRTDNLADISRKIWDWAELGFLEDRSSALLIETLENAGFAVEKGVAGMPTAFIGTWGSGAPVIGILAEFDALPGVSQAPVPYRQMRDETDNGHACGHNLFGAGSVGSAIAVRNWLERSGTTGTIKLFGTPAEEGGGGKIFMVREGLFDEVDAVLSWHPGTRNSASATSSLAVINANFKFHGEAAHAAASPWRGRSAQDAVEAMNYMVNMMREHVTPDTRIHYAISQGAKAANVVPEYAQVDYIIRHPDMPEVGNLYDRVVKISEAAAMGTETTVEHEIIIGYFNKLVNETLARQMHENLKLVGGVKYNDDEMQWAKELAKTFPDIEVDLESAAEIAPFRVVPRGGRASTDVGDISWVVPTMSMGAATYVPGTAGHSWQAVAASGYSIGTKGMMVAAKTMALTAMDIYRDPSIAEKAKAELLERRGEDDFTYRSFVGDQPPPLHYRAN